MVLLATIEKRVRSLELRGNKKSFPCVHEVETVPPVGDLADDMQTTHPDDYHVYVVPLRLHGHISVFRVSAVVRSNVTDGTTAEAGMAIYKYNPGPFTSSDPIKTSEPYSLRRVAKLGTVAHTETADAGTQIPKRFNADLTKHVTLDPRSGIFFVAYTANTYTKWLCPGYGMGDRARRKGRKTGYTGATANDFPEELTVTPQVAPVPWIALRSTLGVRLYGDVENYG